MDFDECDLVDLAVENNIEIYSPFKLTKYYKVFTETEHTLPSGLRMDFLMTFGKRSRCSWIVEFKTTATTDAIIQLYEYWLEYRTCHKLHFKAIYISLAAQYFDEDTLFFCERMGIQCLLLAPINSKKIFIKEIVFGKRKNAVGEGYSGQAIY